MDSLSENTKRGLRQKVRRGEYPSLAPVGYINDSRTKTVIMDKKTAPIIRHAFELYAKGDQTLQSIGEYFERNHLVAKNGKRIHISRATFILSNPFYYGHFRYNSEIYEGKYEPIVAKKLFDQVQEVMKRRSRPRHKQKNEPQAYCGLLSCASCGMQITGEYRVKTQLNGTQHFYTYYHCTKKSKTQQCPEPCIRQESLDAQISSLLQKVSLPQDWADYLNQRLEKDKTESAQSVSAFVEKNQKIITDITAKLQRLLDGYLDQDIDKEIYRSEKGKLLSEKKSLEEEISRNQQKQKHWLEPILSKIPNERKPHHRLASLGNPKEKCPFHFRKNRSCANPKSKEHFSFWGSARKDIRAGGGFEKIFLPKQIKTICSTKELEFPPIFPVKLAVILP